jgi:hypothetical protein
MATTEDTTMAKPKGFNTSYDNAPDMEPGIQASGEMEEIRRDMKSRHINMIAIAGMIVRTSNLFIRPSIESLTASTTGNGSILELWISDCYCRTCRSIYRLHYNGFRHCWCLVYYWRDYFFHAVNRRIRSPCN